MVSLFQKTTFATSEHIHDIGCNEYDGLCGMFIDPKTGLFKSNSVTEAKFYAFFLCCLQSRSFHFSFLSFPNFMTFFDKFCFIDVHKI